MRVSVGVDVAKEVHWASAVDEMGEVLLDRRLPNDPGAVEELVAATCAPWRRERMPTSPWGST